jgi:hypothetical protein
MSENGRRRLSPCASWVAAVCAALPGDARRPIFWPPSSLVVALRWQLRTAFRHGELGLVKHRPLPFLGRAVDAPATRADRQKATNDALLVRRPAPAANFNGTLVGEWPSS